MGTVRRSKSAAYCWLGGAEKAARSTFSSPPPTPVAMVRGSPARKRTQSCSPSSEVYGAATTFILSCSFLSAWLPLVRSKRILSSLRKTRRKRIWVSRANVVNSHPGKRCSVSSRTGWVTGITVRRAANQPRKLWLEMEHQGLVSHTLGEGTVGRRWSHEGWAWIGKNKLTQWTTAAYWVGTCLSFLPLARQRPLSTNQRSRESKWPPLGQHWDLEGWRDWWWQGWFLWWLLWIGGNWQQCGSQLLEPSPVLCCHQGGETSQRGQSRVYPSIKIPRIQGPAHLSSPLWNLFWIPPAWIGGSLLFRSALVVHNCSIRLEPAGAGVTSPTMPGTGLVPCCLSVCPWHWMNDWKMTWLGTLGTFSLLVLVGAICWVAR